MPDMEYWHAFESLAIHAAIPIKYFQIHSIQDSINEYWVRHVYTQNHRATLTKHLLSWLGEKEFRQMIAGGSYNLEQYLQKEALVEVRFTKTVNHK